MTTNHHRVATACYSKIQLSWSEPRIFYVDDIQAVPAGLPGVYVLSAFTIMTPRLVPFYVGQSVCLRRRLAEHLVGHRTFARHLRGHVSAYFAVARVSDPSVRTAVEASLIRRLAPVGNEVVPDAPPVVVNLPSFHLLDP